MFFFPTMLLKLSLSEGNRELGCGEKSWNIHSIQDRVKKILGQSMAQHLGPFFTNHSLEHSLSYSLDFSIFSLSI